MAYSNFTKVKQVMNAFGLKPKAAELFENVAPVQPSDWLKVTLQKSENMHFVSEKERSERLVSPILTELSEINKNQMRIYSGRELNVDVNAGLNGECDYLLSWGVMYEEPDVPIFSIVEAKRNDLELGTAQCLAQMVGAKKYNESNGVKTDILYGASTTGTEWKFMKMDKNSVITKYDLYSIYRLEELLGALQFIVNDTKNLYPVESGLQV